MITERKGTFYLCGKDYAYIMRVTPTGYLQHLYYGKKLPQSDLDYLCAVGDGVAVGNDFNADTQFDTMPSEYGFFARGDYKDPTAIFERQDGASMSRLRYISHKIEKGAPMVAGMPHARTADATLCIVLRDDFSATRVSLYYAVSDDKNTLARHCVITNDGESVLKLKRAFSFRMELPEGNYELLRLSGSWGKERQIETAPISYGITRIQSLRGASSHQLNPFMGILKENCTENSGECYGVQLVYSGSFALTAERSRYGTLCLQGGVCDVGFSWQLVRGESFMAPQVLLTYSCEGLGGVSRSLHDFLREAIINPAFVYKPRPVVVNNWEATYFDFTTEKLFELIDAAPSIGADTFVLDDGWFGARRSDNAGLGDWVVNERIIKGGLKALCDRCKQAGIKFGLWIEPEMVNEDSDLFRTHPDYALCKAGVTPVRSRNQLVLDFTRSEVVDYIFGVISKLLRENDIAYVKWDMNRNITECFSHALPPEQQGEIMHRYILGVYDLAKRLTEAFPTVFFEGCAGGGGRFDAGMLYYFAQIWTSDDTDAYERARIQWGTSLCYPLSAMSCHVSAVPNHQTGRVSSLQTRGAVASLGAFGYELDVTKLSDEEKAQARTLTENYKRVQGLVLKGDLYRSSNPFTGNYFGVTVVSKDKKEAYFVGEVVHNEPYAYKIYLSIEGLKEDGIYEIEELKLRASGKALANVGVLAPRVVDFTAWVWHLREV